MHAKISLVMLLNDGTTIQTLVESINNILENNGGEEEQQVLHSFYLLLIMT
jgi:hypothetical protein